MLDSKYKGKPPLSIKLLQLGFLIGLLSLIQNSNGQSAVIEAGGCRFPGSPAHSSIVFSDETLGPGTVATYTCERGFELLGPSRRVCDSGVWLPEGIPFCVLNVAAGKAPMQVSTDSVGIPQKAIDASTSAFFNSETCTLTKKEKAPWWYVNLLEPYMVQLVRLDFGKQCCANKPATIVVRVGNNRPDLATNPICNRFTGFLEEGQPLFLPCNPPMPGAFVSVHLEVPHATQLSICEAFVYTDQALPIERCPQFRDQPPGNTATYNGKCYGFYNRQPMKFREALQFCRKRGGTLVDESNPALQGFISWELWRRHRSDAQGQYWMGAIRDKGIWQWLPGKEVAVSFWNLPVGTGDCARYDGSKGWLWSDTDCNMHLNFICQHQPNACGRPEQPPNSTMSALNFNVGSDVRYACDEGHLLVGPSERKCLETGFYNEFPPVCKRIECGYPADITNGKYTLLNDSVGYLSRVIYSCDEGYLMVGRAQLACDIDERWNGPPPRCEPVQCKQPLGIPNGVVNITNNETFFGSTISYECNPGYKLVGPSIITCMINGQYDTLPPSCEENLIPSSTTPEITKPTQPPTTITTTRPRSRTPRPLPTTIKATNDIGAATSRTRKPIKVATTINNNTQKPLIIVAGHPQDNEIAGSSNIQHGETPNVNIPFSIEGGSGENREPFGARLNIGAVIALGAFGAFIFLATIITTVVILVRSAGSSSRSSHRLPSPNTMPSRWYTLLALPFPDQQVGRREICRSYRSHRAGYFSNPISRSAKHYRHRASPDCNTVASFDSSSSESRNGGLNRYYRQAWENLHESAGSKSGLKAAASAVAASSTTAASINQQSNQGGNHSPLRRKETMDEPYRARDGTERHRDDSEMVVNDIYGPKAVEKKRHHHHHHHHKDSREWGANRPPPNLNKRY